MGMNQGKAPNMHDVAKLAGVSQRTVSNVVRDEVHVSPSTRAKVKAAIAQLGYRPNVAAQRLREGRTGLIALAVPNLTWPYFSEMAHLVQHEAQQAGWTVVVAETEGNAEYERGVLQRFRSNMIDGLILSPIELGAADLMEMNLGIPVALLGERIHGVGMLHLSIDNVSAARDMARHLLGQGAETFWLVGATETVMTHSAGRLRLQGFSSELLGQGASEDDWRTIPVSPWTQEDAYATMLGELTSSNPLPDAIFCMNDLLAFGTLRACRELGIKVPEDILVSGWDDVAPASYAAPSLTSIAPDKPQIARRAVAGLIDQIEGRGLSETEGIVPFELIIRESTRHQAQ